MLSVWWSPASAPSPRWYPKHRGEGLTALLSLSTRFLAASKLEEKMVHRLFPGHGVLQFASVLLTWMWWLWPRGLQEQCWPRKLWMRGENHAMVPTTSLVMRMIMCSAQTQIFPYLFTENELSAQTREAHTSIYGGAGFTLQCTTPWEMFCFCYTSSQIKIDGFFYFLLVFTPDGE